jgi:hypothetical protein
LERHASKIAERVQQIDEEILRLQADRAAEIETCENLQRTIKSLRGDKAAGRESYAGTVLGSLGPGFPPGYSPLLAIVHVLSRYGPLHRDEIIARLTDFGFSWEGEPRRIVGSTLGKNRERFEEIEPHVFRVRRPTPQADGDFR